MEQNRDKGTRNCTGIKKAHAKNVHQRTRICSETVVEFSHWDKMRSQEGVPKRGEGGQGRTSQCAAQSKGFRLKRSRFVENSGERALRTLPPREGVRGRLLEGSVWSVCAAQILTKVWR